MKMYQVVRKSDGKPLWQATTKTEAEAYLATASNPEYAQIVELEEHTMTQPIFTISDRRTARETVLDSMPSYDSDLCRAEIAAGKIEEIVTEEWASVWMQGDTSFPTEEAAIAYRNENAWHRHVVEITQADVRRAFIETFGTTDPEPEVIRKLTDEDYNRLNDAAFDFAQENGITLYPYTLTAWFTEVHVAIIEETDPAIREMKWSDWRDYIRVATGEPTAEQVLYGNLVSGRH